MTIPPPPPPDAPPPPPPAPGASPPGAGDWLRQPGLLSFLGVVAAGIVAIVIVVAAGGDDGDGGATSAASTSSVPSGTTAPATTTPATTTSTTTTAATTTTSTTTTTTAATTTTTTTTTTVPTTTTAVPSTSLPPGDPYSDYVEVSDDSGRITLDVPSAWDDVVGSAWLRDGEDIGVALSASPDRDAFYDTWGMPGVFIGSTDRLGSIEEYLDANRFDDSCVYVGRRDYEDPLYAGLVDTWADCGPEGSILEILAVDSLDGSELVVVEVIMVSEADRAAVQRIYDTFVVEDA